MKNAISIGLDFGSDSVRALAVDCLSGKELAIEVIHYPRWQEGLYCVPIKNQFRQHPLDFIESMTKAIQSVVKQIGSDAEHIISIGVDATGSSPAPIDENGDVLALRPEFKDNPNAMFILWKDHTAIEEAEAINKLCEQPQYSDFLKGCGGVYSSEWFWSKILHVFKQDDAVKKAATSWIECSDWIPALLSGTTAPQNIKRSRCAAGHKCLWNEHWNGLPSYEFFKDLHPSLVEELPYPLFTNTYTAEIPVGTLTPEWAKKLGLSEKVVIAGGGIDSHVGAVGAGAKPYSLVKVIGTSTCDMMTAEKELVNNRFITGICGQVNGSVVPGYIGFEAGQSAFGDIFAWYQRLLSWPLKSLKKEFSDPQEIKNLEQSLLNDLAQEWYDHIDLDVNHFPISLDWFNGRRTPYANQRMKGTITGMTLASDAPTIFGSLIVATACGARAIMECFIEQNIPIHTVMAIGGIAKKSPIIMQTCADVMNRSIEISESDQCCALGGAIFGAVAAGLYKDVAEAQQHMASPITQTMTPNPNLTQEYEVIYKQYLKWSKTCEPQYNKK